MKIGILTFHWATNYGAVLQCYALQTYLKSLGNEVSVIDYKPRHFDYTLWNYIWYRKFLNHKKYVNSKKKENVLQEFREKHLTLTKRIYKRSNISKVTSNFDMVISGSDQVLNPSFLFNGEGRRKQSTAYFLDFSFEGKKIGYAVSFGCTTYPTHAIVTVSNIINHFDKIGVRENTGLNILRSMNYTHEMKVVPDPTILCYDILFQDIKPIRPKVSNYYCAYILHKNIKIKGANVFYMDEEHNPLTMEAWLGAITFSKGLITNSYHGMIMALLHQIPFVILTITTGAKGMNDRLTTLLNTLELEDRICDENDDYMSVLSQPIDWTKTDSKIKSYSEVGRKFLRVY